MTGFVNIDKAAGVSSAREVNIIKRITGTPCGHLGTLDPMANGVLPVAIGNAARLFDYFLSKRKTYIATFLFGADSETLDTTSELTVSDGRIPSAREIEELLPQLCGEVMQIPPKYSAKNIAGKRGYQLARAGVDFKLPPKKVNIYSIRLLKMADARSFVFEIECGGGTYIRSIARDLGKALGTYAVMSALTRTKSGCFEIGNSVKTDFLTEKNVAEFIIPTDSVLPFESIYPTAYEAKKLFNGLAVESVLPCGTYKIYYTDGSFYGLAEVKDKKLKVRTKLC